MITPDQVGDTTDSAARRSLMPARRSAPDAPRLIRAVVLVLRILENIFCPLYLEITGFNEKIFRQCQPMLFQPFVPFPPGVKHHGEKESQVHLVFEVLRPLFVNVSHFFVRNFFQFF
jgi:hypothetical protein